MVICLQWVGNIDSKVNDVADVNIVVDSKSDLLEQVRLQMCW